MKVFRIKSDVNNYRWFSPEVNRSELLELVIFDCRSRALEWKPRNMILLDPSRLEGNFSYISPGALLTDVGTAQLIGRFFSDAGELLPMWHGDEEYRILNVTECRPALADDATQWLTTSESNRVEIQIHGFDPFIVRGSSIFKIPQTCKGSVLTWEEKEDPETEFKSFVTHKGLTGLIFEEIWSN